MMYLAIILNLLGFILIHGSFPSNYPHYFNWSSETNRFEKGYIELPSNSKSLQPNFLTAPPTERWRGFSAGNQDLIVIKILNDMENGFFIDLAANEWSKGSNTYLLETFNKWKGICIEANPMYHKPLLMNRKCTLFINPVSHKNNEKIKFVGIGGYSGIVGADFDNKEDSMSKHETLELTTVTLATILDFAKAPPIIHYMSLDIEGAEYYAMKGFNFNKYTIWMLTIERPKAKLHYLLAKNGYVFVYVLTNYGETLYIHHSIPNFEKIMKDYHQPGSCTWYNDGHFEEQYKEDHKFVLEPAWSGDITSYLDAAEKLYKLHHHNL